MSILLSLQSPVIGIWKITESWQDMLASLGDNDTYLRETKKIISDKRKQEWLAVRLLLKHLAGDNAHIDYCKNGAPVLKNSSYNISISHTTGFAAVILSKNSYPGIDIEYHSGRAWRLRRRFLGDKELDMFALLDDKAQDNSEKKITNEQLATICWCAKETAYKALQQTEVDFIDHLHLSPFIISAKGNLSIKETKTPSQQTFRINYHIEDDYILTWKE